MGRRPRLARKVRETIEETHNNEKDLSESSNHSLERGEFLLQMMEDHPAGVSSSRKKASKTKSARVRRSARIQNALSPVLNQEIEPVVEEINSSDSEKDESYEKTEKTSSMQSLEGRVPAELNLGERSLEEKVDYLFQLLTKQEKAKEASKHKAPKRSSPTQIPLRAETGYRSLYIDSHKEIEALRDENHKVGKKLENALGKLEAYEKMTGALSEVIEKLKDVILFSNLTRATETAFNLSSQALAGGFGATKPARKRRRVSKGRNGRNGISDDV